jgi:hypothetical protein
MSIFPSIFKEHHPIRQRMLKFGRFNDSYKPDDNYLFWEQALELFNNEKYLDSIESVFKYLSIPKEQNFSYTRLDDQIKFTFYQGSKLVSGLVSAPLIKASAKIAKVIKLDVGFMRMLLESNYDLNFARYCIDEDGDLSINFDSFLVDASPFKMYYGLKELALKADKLDDILVDQYSELDSINTGHIRNTSESIKNKKYQYFFQETRKLVDLLGASSESLSNSHGGVSYLVLSHLYTLDYLLRPEGFLMEAIERIHRLFFAEDGRPIEQKNAKLLQGLEALLDRSEEQYIREFYTSIFTFGRLQEGSYRHLKDLISKELIHMDWYYKNNFNELALAIPKYIAAYCLFYFEIGDPGRAFLSLYMEIIEYDFVSEWNETPSFYIGNRLQGKVIKQELKSIFGSYSFSGKFVKEKLGVLVFDDVPSFSKSYFSMLNTLNF